MATNPDFGPEHQLQRGRARLLAEISEDDPLASHLAEALSRAESPTARYHLREALQFRLTEER